MTEQVRTTYRSHRKAAWAIAIALVLGLAAIAIPIASGAADKTYALEFSATTPVLPLPGTSGNGSLLQNLCTDSTYTSVTLTLKNTAPASTLGSANVTFPGIVSLTGQPSFSGSAPAGSSLLPRAPGSNVVSLRGLNLPKRTGTVSFSIGLTTQSAAVSATSITAMVKQSNDFSDSGQNPDANAFDNPAPANILKITLQTCNTTISGQIYHNRNADSSFTTGTGNFDTSDVPKSWTVNISSKPAGSAGGYTLMSPAPPITRDAATGAYSATVPSGRDYKVCVVATAPDDTSAWGLQAPSGNTSCAGLSASSGTTSAGYLIPASALPASGKDFIAVPATPVFGPGSSNAVPGYGVIAGSNGTKDPTRYTQEVWTSGTNVNFRFAPITACPADADCSKIHLIETMTTDIALTDLGGLQITLKYDDTPPFEDTGATGLKEMPYCDRDPRPSGWPDTNKVLDVNPPNTSALPVLPGTATSCILEGHQTVITGGKVRVTYIVYTSYDGGRQIGVG